MMIDDIKKNEQTEQELTERNERYELNETEMEEVAGGRRAPGPLDYLKRER